MKRFHLSAVLAAFTILIALLLSIGIAAENPITVTLDGTAIEFDVEPSIIDGRTMVPLRAIFEAMGAEVLWDGSTQKITAQDNRALVIAKIGERELTVNGKPIELDVAPQIVNGRTLVPVRFVAESFGADVKWDAETRTASITKMPDKQFSEFPTHRTYTLYSVDGRKVEVEQDELAAYKKVYWYDEPVIFMYSLDGEKSIVMYSNIEKQKSVGWYEEPVTKMYAADGRSNVFPTANVDAQKKVGWYTYPVTTVYKQDGTSKIIPTSDLSSYTSSGWASEPYVTLYTLDGKSKAFPASKAEAQKSVGWYTKDEIQLVKNNSKISSLVYNGSKKGSVTGLITWQYNKYIGTKPDVGAKAMLVQTNKIPLISDEVTFLNISNDLKEDPTVTSTTADGSGNYYFDNVPAGEYYLILQSHKTHASPIEKNVCTQQADSCLSGIISDEALKNIKLGGAVYKTIIVKITVKSGETTRYSKDWGYTAW